MIDTSAREFLSTVVAAGLASALSLAAQAPTQLTTSMRQHEDALISPGGQRVAFRTGATDLGIVDVAIGTEVIAYSSAAALGAFTWAPSNTGLYFAAGNEVRFIGNTGSPSRSIGQITGSNIDVWAVNSGETTIFGTRFDQATATTFLFTVATNGQTAPTDIYSANAIISGVRLDSSGGFLLFEESQGVPFSPVDYVRVDVSGGNRTVLHTTSGTDSASSLHWLDAGSRAVFSMVDPANNRPQVVAVSANPGVEYYTGQSLLSRRTYVARGGSKIVFETQSPQFTRSIGLMDVAGGGVYYVTRDTGLLNINGGSVEGGLSINAAGTRIAFCAEAVPSDPMMQIYVIDLDSPPRVSPRLQVGQPFTIELDLNAGFIGAIAAADGFGAAPFTLPGFTDQFDLQPSTAVTVLVGFGPGTATGTYTVPNNASLVGAFLYFQGVRLTSAQNGSFTSYGYYQVF